MSSVDATELVSSAVKLLGAEGDVGVPRSPSGGMPDYRAFSGSTEQV